MFTISVGKWWSSRYCLAYLAFFGFANVYALRVNLSVAILSMTNNTYMDGGAKSFTQEPSCPRDPHINYTVKVTKMTKMFYRVQKYWFNFTLLDEETIVDNI